MTKYIPCVISSILVTILGYREWGWIGAMGAPIVMFALVFALGYWKWRVLRP